MLPYVEAVRRLAAEKNVPLTIYTRMTLAQPKPSDLPEARGSVEQAGWKVRYDAPGSQRPARNRNHGGAQLARLEPY